MNWIIEAYSNVYNTAMLQERVTLFHAAPAKTGSSRLSRLFGRKSG